MCAVENEEKCTYYNELRTVRVSRGIWNVPNVPIEHLTMAYSLFGCRSRSFNS